MLCKEIMKRRLHTATIGTSALQAAQYMRDQHIGFLPVCDAEGHPLGVVTDRDLAIRVCAENLSAEYTYLSTLMSQNPLSCHENCALEEAEAMMLQRKYRRILVIDDLGRLAGLITLADIAHHQDPFKMAQFVRVLTESRLRIEK